MFHVVFVTKLGTGGACAIGGSQVDMSADTLLVTINGTRIIVKKCTSCHRGHHQQEIEINTI
eukprot:m.1642900 g.1642900  ORF g.1642900 m.1642900 type:complete len:62 (-) comp55785_c0_seq1:208-393(-)